MCPSFFISSDVQLSTNLGVTTGVTSGFYNRKLKNNNKLGTLRACIASVKSNSGSDGRLIQGHKGRGSTHMGGQ